MPEVWVCVGAYIPQSHKLSEALNGSLSDDRLTLCRTIQKPLIEFHCMDVQVNSSLLSAEKFSKKGLTAQIYLP